MGKVTEEMKDVLVNIHGEVPKAIEYESRICMINTLLGDGFNGTFVKEYESRSEALQFAKHLSKFYDVPYVENKENRYFFFNTWFNNSVYDGISARLEY